MYDQHQELSSEVLVVCAQLRRSSLFITVVSNLVGTVTWEFGSRVSVYADRLRCAGATYRVEVLVAVHRGDQIAIRFGRPVWS